MPKRESYCLICGESEWDHHDFSPPPPGCKCEPGDWDGADFVSYVCKKFNPLPADPDRCQTVGCEHNKACHETRDGEAG